MIKDLDRFWKTWLSHQEIVKNHIPEVLSYKQTNRGLKPLRVCIKESDSPDARSNSSTETKLKAPAN